MVRYNKSLEETQQFMQETRQFFRKFDLKLAQDFRSAQVVASESLIVQSLCSRNIKAFNITLTSKVTTQYPKLSLKRVDLPEGMYFNLTDNGINSQQAILTFHGAPGNTQDWSGVQSFMGERLRWINVATPGFDGQDERRGSYMGTYPDIKKAVINLIKKLELKRVIILAHSFGTNFSTRIVRDCPGLFQGFVNMGGAGNLWMMGFVTVYRTCIAAYGYHLQEWRASGVINDDVSREKIYQRYLKDYKEGSHRRFAALFTPFQLFAFIKLANDPPESIEQRMLLTTSLPIPRLLIYGGNDPIMAIEKVQGFIYRVCYGERSFGNTPQSQRLLSKARGKLEARLKEQHGIEIDGRRLHHYLNFILEETGHAIHRRRPLELSQIIKVYLTILDVLAEQRTITDAKL